MNELLDGLALIQDDVRWTLQELQQHDLVLGIAIGAGVILTLQLVLTWWTARRLGEMALMRERLSRLFDGLALLADTTEAGMATMAQEVERVGKRRAATPKRSPRSTRSSVARRVLDAAKDGRSVTEIAEQESMSEGEVHLHLRLAEAGRTARQPVAASL